MTYPTNWTHKHLSIDRWSSLAIQIIGFLCLKVHAHCLLINTILWLYFQYSSCMLSIYPDSVLETKRGDRIPTHSYNFVRTTPSLTRFKMHLFSILKTYWLHFFVSTLLQCSSRLKLLQADAARKKKLSLYMTEVLSTFILYTHTQPKKLKGCDKINISFRVKIFCTQTINHSIRVAYYRKL